MIQLLLLIFVQIIIAGIVVLILKRFLDQELQLAAIEQLFLIKPNAKIDVINVYHASKLRINVKEDLQMLFKEKFNDSKVVYEEKQMIKGGLVITIGDQVLDFSIKNRLENFWV